MAQAEFKQKLQQIDPEKIVFVDETGFDEWFHQNHAYSKIGVPVVGKIYGRKFARTNFVSGLLNGKIVGGYFYRENTKAAMFENWVAHYLLSDIPFGCTIILDNATFHRKKKLEELAQQKNCKILFLPPYSPELNAIEKSWANVKRYLRTNSFANLVDAICGYFKIE